MNQAHASYFLSPFQYSITVPPEVLKELPTKNVKGYAKTTWFNTELGDEAADAQVVDVLADGDFQCDIGEWVQILPHLLEVSYVFPFPQTNGMETL